MNWRDTLFVGGQQLVVELDHINGRKGAGAYLLSMDLEIDGRRDLAGSALMLDGQVSVVPASGGMLHLGQVHLASSPPVFLVDGAGELHTRRVQLAVQVGADQVESVEEARRGGELELLLDLNGLVVGRSTTSLSGQLRYRLEGEVWSRLLAEMQYAKSVVLSIPVSGRRSTRATAAATRLEAALADVGRGRYREAVRECRDLIEALYSDEDELFEEYKPRFPNSREAGMAARLYAIRQAILMLTHAAAHDDEVARTFQWERRDALAVIGLLAALLQQEA